MWQRRIARMAMALLLMPWLTGPAASPRPLANAAAFDAIDAYVEAEMRATHVPGLALVIVQGDRIVHQKGFGLADGASRPVTPQTPFVIGSLSKSFTALAVMQLAQAGQIDLDAPVQHYLPWFRVADPAASAKITPRHLLNQTSGLSRQACSQADQMGQGAGALEQNVRALAHASLSAPPGTAYLYCNSNYQVLGLLVQTQSGQAYAAYVQAHIFDPLDMRHSYASRAAAEEDGLAVGHRFMLGIPVPAYDEPDYNGSVPSGGLIVSAEDMGRYLIAHLNSGRYLDREVISPLGMLALHLPPSRIPGANYAMGWAVGSYAGQPVLSHSGAVPDFVSEMWLLPNEGYGVAVLQSANNTLFGNRMNNIGLGIISLLLGQTPPPAPPDTQAWYALGLVALMVIWQIVSITAGRKLIRADRARPGQWWLGLLAAAALDVAVIVACLYALPAAAQSALPVMLDYSPDLTLLLLTLAVISAVWGATRTVRALRAGATDPVLA